MTWKVTGNIAGNSNRKSREKGTGKTEKSIGTFTGKTTGKSTARATGRVKEQSTEKKNIKKSLEMGRGGGGEEKEGEGGKKNYGELRIFANQPLAGEPNISNPTSLRNDCVFCVYAHCANHLLGRGNRIRQALLGIKESFVQAPDAGPPQKARNAARVKTTFVFFNHYLSNKRHNIDRRQTATLQQGRWKPLALLANACLHPAPLLHAPPPLPTPSSQFCGISAYKNS